MYCMSSWYRRTCWLHCMHNLFRWKFHNNEWYMPNMSRWHLLGSKCPIMFNEPPWRLVRYWSRHFHPRHGRLLFRLGCRFSDPMSSRLQLSHYNGCTSNMPNRDLLSCGSNFMLSMPSRHLFYVSWCWSMYDHFSRPMVWKRSRKL